MSVIALSHSSGEVFNAVTVTTTVKMPDRGGRSAEGQLHDLSCRALPEHPVNGEQMAFKKLLWAALEDTDGAQ